MRWLSRSIERLLAAEHARGGWGYHANAASSAEPTALACLALQRCVVTGEGWRRGLRWLASVQTVDGAVPIGSTANGPYWPTALAVLAWRGVDRNADRTHETEITRAAGWLENAKGVPIALDPKTFGHNTRLIGWPWVADTHSWIEPTAYAIRALTEVGRRDHPRVREGVRLMLDRTLPDGGWNYGNTRVLEHTLRPFPATTGIGLFALAGEPRDVRIDRSIAYLASAVRRGLPPWSLSWGLIGLSAWDAAPSDSQDLLAACAERVESQNPTTVDDALLLWAHGSVVPRKAEATYGS